MTILPFYFTPLCFVYSVILPPATTATAIHHHNHHCHLQSPPSTTTATAIHHHNHHCHLLPPPLSLSLKKNPPPAFYKQTLFCYLVLSLFNLFFCFLNNFYWYRNGWTDEKIVTLLNVVLGALVWLFISVYLHTLVSNSSTGSRKYPSVIRVWWVFFFTVSCYSLVVDYVYYKKTHDLVSMLFVSDSVSSFMGLFLCFMGLSYKIEEEFQSNNLEEPLLSSGVSRGGVASTYENASFYSLLTFSWMNSVIAKGNKKTLDLEDVPQLAKIESVKEVYPVLLNKVEYLSNGGNQITAFGLTKALLYNVWKDVAITGL
ncbi:putative ABC-type xenobiotic transporter [Helianthus annuus]|nr:putative ABC-type xenobiotic transporter [Helianthus annuus]